MVLQLSAKAITLEKVEVKCLLTRLLLTLDSGDFIGSNQVKEEEQEQEQEQEEKVLPGLLI